MVVERFLRALFAKARGSKGGALLVVCGVLILFAFLVFALVSIISDAASMVSGVGPVIEFLETGLGVLIAVAVAVVMVLLGVAFMVNATPQLESVGVPESVIPQPAPTNTDSHEAQENEAVAEYINMVSGQLVEGNFEGFKRSVFALGLEVLQERIFQIGRASMDKGRLVIVVEDAEGILRLGDKLIVVDTEDFYFMGTFEVIQKRAEGCHAVEGKDADGLWKGAVRSGKEGDEVTYKTAILKERRAEQWQATA